MHKSFQGLFFFAFLGLCLGARADVFTQSGELFGQRCFYSHYDANSFTAATVQVLKDSLCQKARKNCENTLARAQMQQRVAATVVCVLRNQQVLNQEIKSCPTGGPRMAAHADAVCTYETMDPVSLK